MDYQKVYNSIISKRTVNPLKKSQKLYTEDHHIVPSCLGGSDNPENLVRLTAREHFVVHRLLSKIYSKNSDLALAVLFMAGAQGGNISSSREVERLRELAARKKSERAKAQWEERGYRRRMTSMACQRWVDETYRNKITEAVRTQYASNKFPWQRPRAQPSRSIWSLAATFWELSPFNKNCKEPFGAKRFSDYFCGGLYWNIFDKMFQLFKQGWKPLDCKEWLEEFSDRM